MQTWLLGSLPAGIKEAPPGKDEATLRCTTNSNKSDSYPATRLLPEPTHTKWAKEAHFGAVSPEKASFSRPGSIAAKSAPHNGGYRQGLCILCMAAMCNGSMPCLERHPQYPFWALQLGSDFRRVLLAPGFHPPRLAAAFCTRYSLRQCFCFLELYYYIREASSCQQ